MQPISNTRRNIILAGITVPLLASMPLVHATDSTEFKVPKNIHAELYKLYGSQADAISKANKISLKSPRIAEDSQDVPISVAGEKGLVRSLAIFEHYNTFSQPNDDPLMGVFTFSDTSDLTLNLRIRLGKTCDIYLIAETYQGLIGTKRQTLVCICGAGG